jgi:hypothetical protein
MEIKLRHILAIILVIVLAFMLLGKSNAAEIQLPPASQLLDYDNIPVQTVEEFAAIPYDFAKNFPDELYYWWAKAHNEREYDLATQGRRVINRVGVTTSDGEFRSDGTVLGNGWTRRSAYATSGTFGSRNTERTFEFREGGGPAVIYNPYVRSKHGSQKEE